MLCYDTWKTDVYKQNPKKIDYFKFLSAHTTEQICQGEIIVKTMTKSYHIVNTW
jgi:hypothetical protein